MLTNASKHSLLALCDALEGPHIGVTSTKSQIVAEIYIRIDAMKMRIAARP